MYLVLKHRVTIVEALARKYNLELLLGNDYQKSDIYGYVFQKPKTKGQIHGPVCGWKMFLVYISEFHLTFFIPKYFLLVFIYLGPF